ncbi:mechanosensitive ion channel family protein [Rufibacter latericius]|uniref:Mechanosensitive ion channel family protein n=1 Tax=Rufibacter latericius TaxID=2487040 RepID=A0A3M9MMB0_9BACT|nr:mechanosensitive ion channel domain-containing protein [Rufibacter latericius]RNI26347.1 mechanosensitive ion channel family protein [Rufibacter latericius]
MNRLLNQTYYHNSVFDYLFALGAIIIGLLLLRSFKHVFFNRFKNWVKGTKTHIDDLAVEGIDRFLMPALYFAIIHAGISYLTLSEKAQNLLSVVTTMVITFLFVRLISSTILLLLKSYVRKQSRGEEKVKQLGGLMLIINAVIWMVGLLFLFDNMGYNVTTIITGLGIGGIAIALAAQNILGDVFNYFVIFFDRPFETGDFIVIDDKSGTVDYIGIKTTRVKSLSGELLVFANSDLTKSRIHNYKQMVRRRVVFKITVTYQTSLENMKEIPGLIEGIVKEHSPVEFDRSHFMNYGDSSLDYETCYYVLSDQYNKYMDIQQSINFRIFEEFQKRGIEFAYPTRTLFVVNDGTEAQEEPMPRRNASGF